MLLTADDVLAEARTLEKLSAVVSDTAKPWIVSRTELCDEALHRTGKFSLPLYMWTLSRTTTDWIPIDWELPLPKRQRRS